MSPPVENLPQCPIVNDNGLTVLFDNTSGRSGALDIVFIHGLNGSPKQTWTHSKSGFYWPWELRAYLARSRVMTFGYDAKVDSSLATNFMRVENVASALLNALALKRWQLDRTDRPLVLVGHSLGGLVAKAAAVSASRYVASKANDLDKLYFALRGFIFFGVPHGGSATLGMKRTWILEKIAKAAFLEIPPKLEEALKAGSDQVIDLADSFRLLSICVEYKIVMLNYFETLSTIGLGTRVVDEASAATHYAKANPPEPIAADHIGMVKFDGIDNVNFQNLSEQLVRMEAKLAGPGVVWDSGDLEHVYDSLAFPQMLERHEGISHPHAKTFEWIMEAEILPNQNQRHSPNPLSVEQIDTSTPTGAAPPLEPFGKDYRTRLEEKKPNPFLGWLRSGSHPVFWISGKAGSGKSTLMKHLYQQPDLTSVLADRFAQGLENLAMAAFFFYDQGKSALQKSREGLFRSLLHQLLKDKRHLWHDLFDVKCREIFDNYDHRQKTLDERLSKPIVHWTWTELRDMVLKFAITKPSSLKVFLLVDGLDEFRLVDKFEDFTEYETNDSSEQALRNILAHKEIAQFFLNLSYRPGFKVCLSSRPVQAFHDAFHQFPGFKLQDLTMGDIAHFVQEELGIHPRVQLLSKFQPLVTTSIVYEVCAKASGVFLWVRLVVGILVVALAAGDSLLQLQKKLNELPPGLRPLYAKMMAGVLPEYRDEGLSIFQRVLAARAPLTGLSLSLSQETALFALNCSPTRLSEEEEQFRVDEITRRLISRCGGLLEIVSNPAISVMRITDEMRDIWRVISPTKRPHIAVAPVVDFVHRSAIEYLQGSCLQQGVNHTADMQLLISCLLRIKLIGQTMHPWEICHAVKDAIFYAKRIEDRAGFSPVELLDKIDATMHEIWNQTISAGRWEDYDKDPGYGDEVIEARRRKRVPAGHVAHTASIWGPISGDKSDADDNDDMMTIAVQGGLTLYLEEQIKRHGPSVLRRKGRPLLAYAVVPRSNYSLLNLFPTSDAAPMVLFPTPELVEWLLTHGLSPNDAYDNSTRHAHGRRTVWDLALTNKLMSLHGDASAQKEKPAIERFCAQSYAWAKSMSQLVDHGADVLGLVAEAGAVTVLEYLFPYWVRYALYSEAIRDLFVKVIQETAVKGRLSCRFESISAEELLEMDLLQLKKALRITHEGDWPAYQSVLKANAPVMARNPFLGEDSQPYADILTISLPLRRSIATQPAYDLDRSGRLTTPELPRNMGQGGRSSSSSELPIQPTTSSPRSDTRDKSPSSFSNVKSHISRVVSKFKGKP